MTVIICLDNRNGMLFNRRRQSRDRTVVQDILKECGNRSLWVNEFSAALFTGQDRSVKISERPFEKVQKDDFCFIENLQLKPYEKIIEKIIVYRWNRNYPVDVYLDIDLRNDWQLLSQTEFAGYSHEKITKEVYGLSGGNSSISGSALY